jgi:hypothetical protein
LIVTEPSPTLEQLEGETGGELEDDSYLVRTIHALRRKPIAEFTIEDLRITLGQRKGIAHLLPLALDRLEADPFARGHIYPGDLLRAVMDIPAAYWQAQPSEAARIARIADRAAQLLDGRPEIEEIKTHLRQLMAVRPWGAA